MATVTGLTAERMAEIVDASIVSGEVLGDDLILTRYDTATINAGNVRGPQGLQGIQGVPGEDGAPGADGADGPPGADGELYPRATAQVVLLSIDNDETEATTITMALSYRILKIETSKAAWVRLYTTVAKRDADVSRVRTVDPVGDHGVIGEWITTSGDLVIDANPSVIGSNLEASPSTAIPIRITNDGISGALTVTFTYQRME